MNGLLLSPSGALRPLRPYQESALEALGHSLMTDHRRVLLQLAERFLEVGVAAEYMDGDTPREDREEVFGRFRSGETRIICNIGVLTTGIDLDVRSIILARLTKSRMLFVQTISRGLRAAEGKDHLLILAFAKAKGRLAHG